MGVKLINAADRWADMTNNRNFSGVGKCAHKMEKSHSSPVLG